ncbi:TetR/AcrR family transcriptional regulator [Gordonia sp. CPCC 205333]|uniref:TetR/AcrR family transcriptional regulator n=1 Tax=Gordonia sp. CPCC 205333 TaxID=3140790 RepID=UPI003AF39325
MRSDARRNRHAITEAALTVFASQGVHAGLEQIARAAGVSVGTIYNRFGDRNGLIAETFIPRIDEGNALLAKARRSTSAWDGLVWYLIELGRLQVADLGFRQVCTLAFEPGSPIAEAKTATVLGFTELVQRAHAQGTLRADVTVEDLGALHFGIIAAADTLNLPNWERLLMLALEGLGNDLGAAIR